MRKNGLCPTLNGQLLIINKNTEKNHRINQKVHIFVPFFGAFFFRYVYLFLGMFNEGDLVGSNAQFRIMKHLTRGGYGDVYIGQDIHSFEKVIIKVYLIEKFDNMGQAEGYWRRERAFVEMQSKFAINALKLLDSTVDKRDPNNPLFFIVLNFIEGVDCEDWFEEIKKNPPAEYIAYMFKFIFIPLADYFFQCHTVGLIYRDFSTGNIMIIKGKRNEPIPVVIDWGAARNYDPLKLYDIPPALKDLPGGGTCIYTPGFESPEVVEGKCIIPQTDIYSFGTIMHYLLTKGHYREKKQFKSDYVFNPSAIDSAIPNYVSWIVQKCTQYEPAQRYLSFEELKKDLTKALDAMNPQGEIFKEALEQPETPKNAEQSIGKILVLGLQTAGKTAILTRLNKNEFDAKARPTLGIQLTRVILDTLKLEIHDVGGQKSFRRFWTTTVALPNAVIYVIDISSPSEMLSETVAEFERVMTFFKNEREEYTKRTGKQLPKLILLIYGNKHDLVPSFSKLELEMMLQPDRFNVNYQLALCSAAKNEGIITNFKWLAMNLLEEQE